MANELERVAEILLKEAIMLINQNKPLNNSEEGNCSDDESGTLVTQQRGKHHAEQR